MLCQERFASEADFSLILSTRTLTSLPLLVGTEMTDGQVSKLGSGPLVPSFLVGRTMHDGIRLVSCPHFN